MTAGIQAASFSIPDTLFIVLLALVVFGPRRLPEIGRQIGKLMYEFRKASNEFKYQMEEELRRAEETDRVKKLEEENRALMTQLTSQSALPETTGTTLAATAATAESGVESVASESSEPETAVAEAHSAPTGNLRVQPPSTGMPMTIRGKSMAELTAESENKILSDSVALQQNGIASVVKTEQSASAGETERHD